MKKLLKRLGILLLLGTLVFSLCGCKALDEMRERQIIPDADGSFTLAGNRYVPLDTNEYFNTEVTFEKWYYLTQPDVPVLLSDQFYDGLLYHTKDGRFVLEIESNAWYCREDVYREMQEKQKEDFTPTILFYDCSYYEEGDKYVEKTYILNEEEVAALAQVQQTTPLGTYLDYEFELVLINATEDMLFRQDGPVIAIKDGIFYVTFYTEDRVATYQVPEDLVSIFEGIIAAYMEAYG